MQGCIPLQIQQTPDRFGDILGLYEAALLDGMQSGDRDEEFM